LFQAIQSRRCGSHVRPSGNVFHFLGNTCIEEYSQKYGISRYDDQNVRMDASQGGHQLKLSKMNLVSAGTLMMKNLMKRKASRL
jgi:hypothetical protein